VRRPHEPGGQATLGSQKFVSVATIRHVTAVRAGACGLDRGRIWMFSVLVHPDLYQRLRHGPRPLRARVHRTLARLRDGRWGGGTRVKRLRGVARAVYEARTDGGDRLLFTMARRPAGGAGVADPADPKHRERLVLHLEVWDLVEHDDAERVARRSRAPEAEFLELGTLEEFDIAEPPPHPEAPVGAFTPPPGEDDGAGDLLHFLLPATLATPETPAIPENGAMERSWATGGTPGSRPAGGETAPWGADDECVDNIRWFRLDPAWLADEDEFQRLLDRGGDELELMLTREQYQILQAPGPLLLAGSAGSGKTTLAVHRLVEAALTPGCGRILYLSYSAALVEHARRLFADLLAAHPKGAAGGTTPAQPDFHTFDDLYRSLVSRDFAAHQARPMNAASFEEWFRRAGRALDPALVWEEVRSILKGACLRLERGAMLPAEEYFDLGRKRAPLFVEVRPEIYRIAERYQEWLTEEGRLDSIDLCRLALAELRRRRGGPYDVVVCDEIQDLTEIEVGCVLALSARSDLAGVLLTGDALQIVNPSGFRWAEVRRLAARRARQQAAPPVLRLRSNRRGTRPLVALANALLKLRRDIYGRGEEEDGSAPASAGPVPVEAVGDEAAVCEVLAGFGPRCLVLVRDAATAAALAPRLGGCRVLPIEDAKGLEVETVVAWKLLSADGDLVDRHLRGDARLEGEPRFARLLRLLYVAVTRARRHLAIYEGGETPHPFWSRGPLAGCLARQPLATLAGVFRVTASPAEWEACGAELAAAGQQRQAAECFRRAGLAEREAEALAHAAEAEQDWAAALARWQDLGVVAAQAPLLERLGRLAEAAARYRDAGRGADAHRCELLLLERQGDWSAAARGWEALGEDAAAARCFAAAGEPRAAAAAAARAAEAAGDPRTAAGHWLESGAHAHAARCFAAAGDAGGAALAGALADEAAARWGAAAAGFRRCGRRREARRCLALAHEVAAGAGGARRAARLWQRLDEPERALALLIADGAWLEVARLEPPAAAGRRRLLGRAAELLAAGDCAAALELLAARRQALAARLPEVPWFLADEAERRAHAERRELEALSWRARAAAAEQLGAWSRASRCWRLAGEPGDLQRAAAALDRRIEGAAHAARRTRATRLRAAAEAGAHPEAPG
jgi:DNA helicase-2/ATP-dependent DNA helicase PcrA